jgi:hypothetical protein
MGSVVPRTSGRGDTSLLRIHFMHVVQGLPLLPVTWSLPSDVSVFAAAISTLKCQLTSHLQYKLLVAHLVKIFPAFYGGVTFTAMFKKACHCQYTDHNNSVHTRVSVP